MEVEIDTNLQDIRRRIGKKGDELSASIKQALSITAQVGINIIEARTSKGVGFKGKFKAYTPIYAAFRQSRGRSAKPDLQFTGQMLGSMTSRTTSKQAEIFFSRATESKKAAMNNIKRPFFGFNKKEQEKLGEVFFKALK
mgnify:CR=1 FL=1|tara:strand:+ start:210 stop:629 length:420 start_codon:yes stop_codon:yes gene_type:complete